jgi:hypothetical protein
MPRKLPWEDGTSTASRPSKAGSAPAPKRQKLSDKKDDRTPSPKKNIDGGGELVGSYFSCSADLIQLRPHPQLQKRPRRSKKSCYGSQS